MAPLTLCDVPEAQVPLDSNIMYELLTRALENSHNAWKALLLFPRMVFTLSLSGRKYDHQVRLNMLTFKASE